MKLFMTFLSLMSISWTAAAGQSEERKVEFGKLVAICGAYNLSQNESTTVFAGIIHKTNTYEITGPQGENGTAAQIETNSDGAELSATEVVKADSRTGAVTEYRRLLITAMRGEFYLTSTDQDGKQVKVPCYRVK